VIDAEKANYKIAFMCRLLRVPRSSFYALTSRVETPTKARRRALAVEVAAEFAASRQTSGCRRITAALNRRGIECSVGLVADLMREVGLAAVQPRAYKRVTVPGQEPVSAPDLVQRDFAAPAPEQRLVGDITYLRTGEAGCTPPSATAPRSKHSPTTELRRPPQRDQPEDLSTILDTTHARVHRGERVLAWRIHADAAVSVGPILSWRTRKWPSMWGAPPPQTHQTIPATFATAWSSLPSYSTWRSSNQA
jgi:hypothetical protein